jgi:hypothetical protein
MMKVISQHSCSGIQHFNDGNECSEVAVVFMDGKSYLSHTGYANESNVQLGEADYVGEEIFRSDLLVVYCPFCGIRLPETTRQQ